MFKGVSQCMPSVGVLYFGLFNPFEYSPLPLYLPSPVFQKFSVHILITSTFTSYGTWYYWSSIILFSFPSFLQFHRVVPLLQTCSTFEFVYTHAYFCVYIYLWIYLSSSYEGKHASFGPTRDLHALFMCFFRSLIMPNTVARICWLVSAVSLNEEVGHVSCSLHVCYFPMENLGISMPVVFSRRPWKLDYLVSLDLLPGTVPYQSVFPLPPNLSHFQSGCTILCSY
jgi:hypothetical protein